MKRILNLFTSLSLYQKFALAIASLGLFPILLVFPILMNRATGNTMQSIRANYRQAAFHINSSVENTIAAYDTASKVIYHYTGEDTTDLLQLQYQEYDNLRRILVQEDEAARRSDMAVFLRSISGMGSYITSVHFLSDSEETGRQSYHYSVQSRYLISEEAFEKACAVEELDKASRNLLLLPVHNLSYYSGSPSTVLTIARNYFDLRGAVGNSPYIGTLFIDIDIEHLRTLFRTMQLDKALCCSLLGISGDCIYSTDEEKIGQILWSAEARSLESGPDLLVFDSGENRYGLRVISSVPAHTAFSSVYEIRQLMLWMFIAIALALIVGAFIFSRRLTRPIYEMLEQMGRIETGHFDIQLPVRSHDEVGILAERFNEMSRQLENYIEKSYLASLRQNEAELTALKSQIYPHFLYNTLEIIRMSALENDDRTVADMIEALSEQIHYIIGPMEDMVPIGTEIGIIEKYIFLLNCRISGKVRLVVNIPDPEGILIPKLMLQPIVENAYVHGIRPKTGSGSIMIEAQASDGVLTVDVIDNGTGMDEEALERITQLLSGDAPGIRNEYNWQSIGLKNVHDRIRYMYGSPYGIHVTSTPGVGTAVQLTMPLQKKGETSGKAEV